MELFTGNFDGLGPHVMADLARYRYRVFVERLGWDLACVRGWEVDQFDRADTLYVVARGVDGQVIGCARLLQTMKPYLLEAVFPQLMGATEIPKDHTVWELSRFSATDLSDQRCGQPTSDLVRAVLDGAFKLARNEDAETLLTVTTLSVERLLKRYGYRVTRVATPVRINSEWLVASWITIPPKPLNSATGFSAARTCFSTIGAARCKQPNARATYSN